jgi:hypothetical protein
MNEIDRTREQARGDILSLEGAVRDLPQYTGEVIHHFAPGLYARELRAAKDSLVVGKLHKHAHFNTLLEGECSVATEFGDERIVAPAIWVSEPGTKRAIYCHTDIRWVTYHPTEETDLDKIEEAVIAPDYNHLLGDGT